MRMPLVSSCCPWAPLAWGRVALRAKSTIGARAKSSRFCTLAHCLLGGSLTRGFASRLDAPFQSRIDRVIFSRAPARWSSRWFVGWLARGWVLLAACSGLVFAACSDQAEPAAEQGGTSLWFAPLTGTGCTATTNGKKQIPPEVDNLVAVWTATLADGGKKTGTARTPSAKIGQGSWEIKGIPAAPELDLDVYACSKDKKLVFAGRNTGLKVTEGPSRPVPLFLAPTDKLACTGSATGSAKLTVGRSLASSAVLISGDAVIVGGLSAWNKTAGSGTGSDAVDVYDARLGHFVAGPKLSAARILPHVHAISKEADKPQLLVVGGALSVMRKAASDKFVISTLVPEKIDGATPATKAELLDLTPGKAATKVLDKVDVGVGAYVLSSSIRLDKAVLFVGGVSETGQVMDKATRLGNPEEIAIGGTGKSDSVKLNAARVRPALLSFTDGTAVIWGGAVLPGNKPPLADAMGELLAADTPVSEKLAVTGPAALVDDPNLSTIAPVVVPIARTADVLTFLVAGGMPVKTPLTALAAPTYLVTVTKSSKTAELRQVTLPGGLTLRAGLFGVGIALEGRRALLGGGLIALTVSPDVAALCAAADAQKDDCALDTAWMVRVPDVMPAGDSAVQLELLATLSLGGPRIGVAAAPLPLGALLAGGQASTRSGDTADVLDDVGEVLTVTPPTLDIATICQ